MKLKIATVSMPESEIGTTTLMNAPKTAAAVDHGGFFDVSWDRFEKAHHQPRGERHCEGWIDQYEGPSESSRFKLTTTRDNGMNKSVGGTK